MIEAFVLSFSDTTFPFMRKLKWEESDGFQPMEETKGENDELGDGKKSRLWMGRLVEFSTDQSFGLWHIHLKCKFLPTEGAN